MSEQHMRHAFVRAIPDILEPDMLYISLDYVTTSHLCACGCGAEVVLPLHPTKWRMTFDGASVSMAPSIGSRTLPCRSHYWIDKGRVRWSNKMNDDDFQRALNRDQRADRDWHDKPAAPKAHNIQPAPTKLELPTSTNNEIKGNIIPIFRIRSAFKRLLGL